MSKYIKILIAFIISITGLYFAFVGQDLTSLKENISIVNTNEIFIAVALLILSCLPRAYRWKLLVEPFEFVSGPRLFLGVLSLMDDNVLSVIIILLLPGV